MSKLDELKAQAAEIQRRIDIIESHTRGETIQIKVKDSNRKWSDMFNKTPGWDFERCDFRKKPEPAVFYRNQYPGGCWVGVFSDDELAKIDAGHKATRVAVKFVEVVE